MDPFLNRSFLTSQFKDIFMNEARMYNCHHAFFSVPTSNANLLFILSLLSQDKRVYFSQYQMEGEINLDELLPIRKSLSAWNLEEFMDEIIYNIYGKPFLDARRNKGISHWNQDRLIQWISSLKCLCKDASKLVTGIVEECVDGETFPILISLNSKNPFNLSYVSLLIINTILHQWSTAIEYVLPDKLPAIPIGK